MMHTRSPAIALLIGVAVTTLQAEWQPKAGPLMTRWAKDVSPDNVHPEYPRPQMVRAAWQNLNGLWDYAIRPKEEDRPREFDGRILVPFPLESALSGVMLRIDEQQRLWYRRMFDLPTAWAGRRALLHFGAVDWEATVWLNGRELGTHRGGYDPFTFDATDALISSGAQEIVVAVWDPTDAGCQPRGKQVRKPEGIWYTPTTGIWQTVWLEPVPEAHIEGLQMAPDIDAGLLRLGVDVMGAGPRGMVKAVVLDSGRAVASATGAVDELLELRIENPKLWSPDTPFLYDLNVTLTDDGTPVDEVTSYFGMRKVSLGQDGHGITRIMLNNKPLFMFGPLDQGFWPDGLYTAPTDEALRYDVEMTRKLGCNLARKHVKVEPERWYYWCDRLGLLVWQDMPSGDKETGGGQREIERSEESAAQYELELRRLIDARANHPSLVMWVPFNEGWGQFETRRIVEWVRRYDPTRLVDCASGWHDFSVGDVHDVHSYPGPAAPDPEPHRAAVLGEFGGLGLPVAEHAWQAEKSWGYRRFYSGAELTEAYVSLLNLLRPMTADPGLSAAVYTQTTDVEIEVNGLLTYDRALVKMDADRVAAVNRRLYLPPPLIKTVVPTSQAEGIDWCYTLETPPEDWYQADFVDSEWFSGPGGFGRDGTPGISVRTAWHTPDIWIRRCFDLAELPGCPHLKVYHDEDCEVFINGKPAAFVEGYTTSYVLVPILDQTALRVGPNIIAVHCHQTGGGQGIDVGLVDLIEQSSDRPAAGR